MEHISCCPDLFHNCVGQYATRDCAGSGYDTKNVDQVY
jgi:hypothetical protein